MEKNQCTNCGTDNSTRAKYCMNCGFSLPNYQPEVKVEEPVKPKKKKFSAAQWIGFIAAFLVFYALGNWAFDFAVKRPSFDKAMVEMASQINESCPIMVDSDTRLDNAMALPDNTFQYTYTLVNAEKDSIDIDSLREYLTPQITNWVKTNPDMEKFRELKVKINYLYKDKFGVYLLTVEVTPEDYES